MEVWVEHFPLTRPYAISYRYLDSVENIIVKVHTDRGLVGWGAASPGAYVTGETVESAKKALDELSPSFLEGYSINNFFKIVKFVAEKLAGFPGARAALEMALYDLFAQYHQLPLVDLLGREHKELPTSITIGIKSLNETLEEAKEYLERKFKIIKLKLGRNLEEDLEKVFMLKEFIGEKILL